VQPVGRVVLAISVPAGAHLTQAKLGRHMRVSDQTIANYEKENTKLLAADPHMRILYLLHVSPPESRASLIKALVEGIAKRQPGPKMPEVPRRKIVDGWRTQELVAA
jgi:transcriptional regulator with XRE-family HTH domain